MRNKNVLIFAFFSTMLVYEIFNSFSLHKHCLKVYARKSYGKFRIFLKTDHTLWQGSGYTGLRTLDFLVYC